MVNKPWSLAAERAQTHNHPWRARIMTIYEEFFSPHEKSHGYTLNFYFYSQVHRKKHTHTDNLALALSLWKFIWNQ